MHIVILITSIHICLTIEVWAGLSLSLITKTVVHKNCIKLVRLVVLSVSFKSMHFFDLISIFIFTNVNRSLEVSSNLWIETKQKQIISVDSFDDLC